ncbi:Outer membrane protein [Helicobacter sp. NHP19-003]|uniref:Outer membrane protein n=1 Tax=Helicobacter gastrocanis TaxID=2849641 RepID=A0ABN6I4Y8_9HELI|nr:outer membrane protein [Helicobacter sp. NHP19-003]BCZ17669.1 Outer membrane protein [Helicobacter sp. NHP19-003]
MNRKFYAFLSSALAFGATGLQAERNAWYVGASYEVGQVGQAVRNPSPDQAAINPVTGGSYQFSRLPAGSYSNLAVMQGLGISVGYKQFFGKKKWFGLRYYGFMDYGHAVFGANELVPGKGTFANLTDMFTYGVGIDTLYDVINKQDVTFGFFLGAAIAGNSWGNTTGGPLITINYPATAENTIDPAMFQFLFNLGMRTTIGKHQEFDFGIKIPTINDYYFNKKGLSFTYRRQYSLYVGYRYNF